MGLCIRKIPKLKAVVHDLFLSCSRAGQALRDAGHSHDALREGNLRIISTAAAYYNDKRYVDDAYAKGKELHKRIVPGLEALKPLLRTFSVEIAALEARQKQDSLQDLRAEGLPVRAAMAAVVYVCQDLCAELQRQKVSGKNMLELDLSAHKAPHAALSVAVDALEKAIQDPGQLRKEGLPGSSAMKAYLDDARAVRTSAAGIIERVQKREAVSKGEAMNTVNPKNTPEAVLLLTSRLISRHNGIQ